MKTIEHIIFRRHLVHGGSEATETEDCGDQVAMLLRVYYRLSPSKLAIMTF